MNCLNRIFIIAAFLFVLCNAETYLYSQETGQSTVSLKGIAKMGLLVENINPLLNSVGIDGTSIKNIVQAKLDEIGIKTVPMKELKNIKGAPYLYINIGAIKSSQGNIYSVSINVEFRQNVLISRNTKLESFGTPTWTISSIGLFSKNKISRLYDFVKKAIDKFIYAYSYANSH